MPEFFRVHDQVVGPEPGHGDPVGRIGERVGQFEVGGEVGLGGDARNVARARPTVPRSRAARPRDWPDGGEGVRAQVGRAEIARAGHRQRCRANGDGSGHGHMLARQSCGLLRGVLHVGDWVDLDPARRRTPARGERSVFCRGGELVSREWGAYGERSRQSDGGGEGT